MADKQITVAVPEERVAEFYSWFGRFLAGETGRGRRRGPGRHREAGPWSAQDADQAAWLYAKLAPPARELFDALIDTPGERISGNELASRLDLSKGAHGVAGVLAWPGRYARKLGREFPIATEGREDGGTDYFMEKDTAELFKAARATND